MNNEQEDQVQQPEGQETSEEQESTDDQAETQSEDSASSENKVFRFNGKDLSADELYEETRNLQKGFTQTTQRLSALEKQMSERAEQSKVTKDAIKDTVPDDVKETVWEIVKPRIESVFNEREQRIAAQERQRQFESKFDELTTTYDGKGGKPKFDPRTDKERVLEFIREDGTVFDPITAYEKMHRDEIRDWWVKEALSKKSGTSRPERTSSKPGGSTLGKTKNPPKSWAEASKRAISRE